MKIDYVQNDYITVGELIEKLKKFDKNAKTFVFFSNSIQKNIIEVGYDGVHNDKVYIHFE